MFLPLHIFCWLRGWFWTSLVTVMGWWMSCGKYRFGGGCCLQGIKWESGRFRWMERGWPGVLNVIFINGTVLWKYMDNLEPMVEILNETLLHYSECTEYKAAQDTLGTWLSLQTWNHLSKYWVHLCHNSNFALLIDSGLNTAEETSTNYPKELVNKMEWNRHQFLTKRSGIIKNN